MPDRRLARGRLVAAALALGLGAPLTGCSDDGAGGGAGTSTVAVFCGALGAFDEEVDAADAGDLPAYVATLKAAAEELAAVGLPDDMSGDARRGFELTVERIRGLPDDATEDDVAALGDVGEDEQRQLDAMNDYIERACPELSEDDSPDPSGEPSP